MRIDCPLCGTRDRREFYCQGSAEAMARPDPDAGEDAWDALVYTRENPAGPVRELWQHEFGCGSWLVVTRNTVTHDILKVEMAADVALASDREGAA